MTLEDIAAIPKDFLTPDDVAPYLHCSPQWIREMARKNRQELLFPVQVVGRRTQIPKMLFVKTYRGELVTTCRSCRDRDCEVDYDA